MQNFLYIFAVLTGLLCLWHLLCLIVAMREVVRALDGNFYLREREFRAIAWDRFIDAAFYGVLSIAAGSWPT